MSTKPSGSELLRQMRLHCRDGRFRSGIAVYMKWLEQVRLPKATHLAALEMRMQFAKALQHAGLFLHALQVYDSVERDLTTEHPGKATRQKALADIRFNAVIHQGVLWERLGEMTKADAIFRKLGKWSGRRDVHLGRASLESWIRITLFKLAWRKRDPEGMLQVASECLSAVWDRNQQIWGQLFHALGILAAGRVAAHGGLDSIVRQCREAQDRMDEYDMPGSPWVSLLAGQVFHQLKIGDGAATLEFLQRAHDLATAFGKLFVVGEGCAALYEAALPRDRIQAELYLRRAFAAYGKSAVLLADLSVGKHLIKSAFEIWDGERVGREVMAGAALLLDRRDIRFGRMCRLMADRMSRRGHKVKPDKVFEDFVSDWSFYRLPGRPEYVAGGTASIDGLLVLTGKGDDGKDAIAIQAKLYAEPRKVLGEIKRPRLRDINQNYGVRVRCFWFVVATSRDEGWDDGLWHDEYRKQLIQLIDNPDIEVRVFLEPDLQTDVIIHDALFHRYFSEFAVEMGAPG